MVLIGKETGQLDTSLLEKIKIFLHNITFLYQLLIKNRILSLNIFIFRQHLSQHLLEPQNMLTNTIIDRK